LQKSIGLLLNVCVCIQRDNVIVFDKMGNFPYYCI